MAGSNVPEEVLAKIVAKMSSKPLAQFKSVSKHWNRVISDPSFMNTFRKHQMTLLPIFPFHVRDPVDRSIVNLGCPFGDHFSEAIMFVGTFQGVVLVVLEEKDKDDLIILYNPFTGVFKTVPAPPANPRFIYRYPNPLYVYGFGYGTTPDDLKIVRFEVFNETKDCQVFSLKNGSWSTLLDVIGDYIIIRGGGRGTFVNGFLYWIARRNERKLVVQLDIENMVFSEIPLPSFIGDVRGLDTLDGCLCAFVTTDVSEYGLWAMKEHGSEKSWLKVCLLPSVLGDDNFVRPRPMCILDGGKIVVLSREDQLSIYDISSGSYDSHKVLDALEGVCPYITSTIEYLETLTSPSDMCISLI
ncbi:F-box domain-containing protein [Artemisia annua]|uniref:F-box domain-containing protein n=1 Tax=Artemisia annua TaxID=35608 RepID=A0A2U1LZU0_ARTAN|nr:F-box domain-containing protein [Artemisia annua]